MSSVSPVHRSAGRRHRKAVVALASGDASAAAIIHPKHPDDSVLACEEGGDQAKAIRAHGYPSARGVTAIVYPDVAMDERYKYAGQQQSSSPSRHRRSHTLRDQRTQRTRSADAKILVASEAQSTLETVKNTNMYSEYVKDAKSIHSLPAHKKVNYSPLAHEAPEQSYRGLMNLAALVLIISNLRLLIENFTKYGLLVSLPGTSITTSDFTLFCAGLLFHIGNILVAFLIEWDASELGVRYYSTELGHRHLWRLNVSSVLVIPVALAYFGIVQPVLGTILLMFSICLFFKLVSYHLVNAELRYFFIYNTSISSYNSSQYPLHITWRNLLLFVAYPTLCYQPVYPRLPHFRLRKILRFVLELTVCCSIIYFMIEQYVSPVLKNTVRYITNPSTGAINLSFSTAIIFIERLLKLSVNVIYIWLLMFYALFHCYLNLLAELTLFGDREFYLAWWNCSTIAAYWRLWNQPVHTWLKRHVYIPLVSGNGLPDPFTTPEYMFTDSVNNMSKKRKRYSKFQAAGVIFLISAVFHELLIATPVKIFRLHAFNAIFLQIPLVILTQVIDVQYRRWRPEGVNTIGNIIMWCAFCVVGQPIGAMMYYMYDLIDIHLHLTIHEKSTNHS